MADPSREPKLPPITTPLFEADGKTMTRAWYRYFQGERGYSDNVNSGVALARQEAQDARTAAAAAQGTATGAVNGIADLASQSLSFSATVSPAEGAFGSDTTASVTTNIVTVAGVGGTPPFVSYAWVIDGSDITINSPASASTSFSNNGPMARDEYRSQAATCTITDSAAATTTITIGVALYREAYSGGGAPP